MRTFSTPESALKGEITKLAIVECVISIAIYVGIGYYRHTFVHYAWTVAIAPLFLFRTDQSSDWGLRLYKRAQIHLFNIGNIYSRSGQVRLLVSLAARNTGNIFDRGRRLRTLLRIFNLSYSFLFFGPILHRAAFALIPVAGSAIRIVATVYWLLRRPVHTLSEMPRNWVRQALCLDFCHPPEILPLEASRGKEDKILTFAFTLEAIRKAGIGALSYLLPLLVVGYLPSLLYRVSFKATALVYAPFVWVAHTSLHSPLNTKARLERFTKGEMEKVRRALSLFVLAVIGLKLGIVLGWFDVSQIIAKIPSPKLVSSVIEPLQFPWWQGTLVTDALLTFFLFFFADAALARLDQNVWPKRLVISTISGGTFLRNVLSILTMAHLCRIAVLEVLASKSGNVFGG